MDDRVSIPFRVLVGFLLINKVPALVDDSWNSVSIPFRVLVRFLPVNTATYEGTVELVSIPFRVLVGFLPG